MLLEMSQISVATPVLIPKAERNRRMIKSKCQSEIRDFHYIHGAVLARILRANKPVSVMLLETEAGSWSSYDINLDHRLIVLTGTNLRRVEQGGAGYSWTCQVSDNQMKQIACRNKSVCIACVLPRATLKDSGQFICFLSPNDVQEIVDTSNSKDTFVVRKLDKKNSKFQVFRNKKVRLEVNLNAIDTYQFK